MVLLESCHVFRMVETSSEVSHIFRHYPLLVPHDVPEPDGTIAVFSEGNVLFRREDDELPQPPRVAICSVGDEVQVSFSGVLAVRQANGQAISMHINASRVNFIGSGNTKMD